LYRTGRDAGGAVDALNGVDVKHVIANVKTVYKTGNYTFRESTGFAVVGYNVGHW